MAAIAEKADQELQWTNLTRRARPTMTAGVYIDILGKYAMGHRKVTLLNIGGRMP